MRRYILNFISLHEITEAPNHTEYGNNHSVTHEIIPVVMIPLLSNKITNLKKKRKKNRIKLLKKNKQINKYKSILICLDWADPQLATRRHVAIYGMAGLGL